MTRTRATALYWLANAIRHRRDQARCVALCEESVALFRSIGDQAGLAMALSNLGFMLRDVPDYPRAHAAAEEGLELARKAGNWRFLGWSLYVLASIMWFDRYVGGRSSIPGDPAFDPDADRDAADDAARAFSLLEESLAIYRQYGVARHVAIVLAGGGSLSGWAWTRGDYPRAEAAYAEALDLSWQLGAMREIADLLRRLGATASDRGDAGERGVCGGGRRDVRGDQDAVTDRPSRA